MGGRNRVYLSQGWTGADGKQIVPRTARVCAVLDRLSSRHLWGVVVEFCLRQAHSGHVHVPVWGI